MCGYSIPSMAASVVVVCTCTSASWGVRLGTGSRLGVRFTRRRSATRCWTPAATTPEGMACGAMRALDLPETEAPHLGVSSGGVEVEGTVFVRASAFTSSWPQPHETRVETDADISHILGYQSSLQQAQKLPGSTGQSGIRLITATRPSASTAPKLALDGQLPLPAGIPRPPPPSWRWMGSFHFHLPHPHLNCSDHYQSSRGWRASRAHASPSGR